MKSPGGDYKTPKTWKPPDNLISRPGQTSAPVQNYVPEFLPSQVGADGQMPMATGLTQQMLDAINKPTQTTPAAKNIMPIDQGRNDLAKLMGGSV